MGTNRSTGGGGAPVGTGMREQGGRALFAGVPVPGMERVRI